MRDEQEEILKLKRDLVPLRVFWLLLLAEAQPVILLHVGEFACVLMLVRKYSDSCWQRFGSFSEGWWMVFRHRRLHRRSIA